MASKRDTRTLADTETRKVPKRAFCFRVGAMEFAADDQANTSGQYPFSLLARSAQPIFHWWWGKVVHDMAGFKASKPTIPVDYCHNPNEVLGFSNKFQANNDGLRLDGSLVQFEEKDRVAEITHKRKAGVPYEASIYFDPYQLKLEELGPGQTADVNGYQLEGPALIIREWMLRGVAVCPYGADGNTDSQFAGEIMAGDVDVQVHLSMEKATMPPENTNEKKPVPAEAGQQSQKPAEPTVPSTPPTVGREQFAAELKRYTDRFGAENGVTWFNEGKSYDEASDLHIAELQTQLSAERAKVADRDTKLAAVNHGEASAVSFSDNEQGQPGAGNGAPVPEKFAHIGDKLGKFAAGIKLPK